MPLSMRLLFCCLLGLLALPPAAAEENANARRILEKVEQRLLNARYVDLYAHVSIEGPFERQLNGSFIIDESGTMTGSFRGTIGKDPATVAVKAEGEQLSMTLNQEQRNGTQPPALREAILVGLMRVGFAQSLIAFSQLQPPERAGGGVRDWVSYANVNVREASLAQGYHNGEIGLQFDLMIGGQVAGHARLWISTQTQLPTRREQFLTYQDAEGKTRELQIDENFSRFVVEP